MVFVSQLVVLSISKQEARQTFFLWPAFTVPWRNGRGKDVMIG
ncbi:MAG: hypothetical protein AAFQ83_22965 [Bacteroidota bacterium]